MDKVTYYFVVNEEGEYIDLVNDNKLYKCYFKGIDCASFVEISNHELKENVPELYENYVLACENYKADPPCENYKHRRISKKKAVALLL